MLIAGGEGKGLISQYWHRWFTKTARCVILFGRDVHIIEQALDQAVPVLQTRWDLSSAVTLAAEKALNGDECALVTSLCQLRYVPQL